jgi:hypothetical protein
MIMACVNLRCPRNGKRLAVSVLTMPRIAPHATVIGRKAVQ